MARLKRSQFLGIAVVFHLLYVYSIFDIYFVSPVVGGMKAHRVQASPPAQRVVLFVGRGDHPHFSLPFSILWTVDGSNSMRWWLNTS